MIQSIDINNFGFLDCYRDRNYEPALGRFLSEDPIGFMSKDYNLYRYVKNNPLKYNDPSGQNWAAGYTAIRIGISAVLGEIAAICAADPD